MGRPPLEVADIFRQFGPDYRVAHAATLLPEQRRVMRAIEGCRTAAMGGHIEECDRCGERRIAYNSCRNRHCPKCQARLRATWVEAREADLLPVPYFHVVFTVPEQIADLALQNKRVLYAILFDATAETLRRIARDPKHLGAEIGFLAVLHTWGQTLTHHPHLHCVIPGGGLSSDGTRWIACRPRFFLPVRVLSRLFRRLFLERLSAAFARGELEFFGELAALEDPEAFAAWVGELRRIEWVVYAKRPFGGPKQVLRYLGRYTHRVAIANSRLVSVQDERVTFRYKDYREGNREREMTLSVFEFIRRFLLHVLPRGFQRIRQYGVLANRRRAEALSRCRVALGVREPSQAASPSPPDASTSQTPSEAPAPATCPRCHLGSMRRIATLAPDRYAPSLMAHPVRPRAPNSS